MTNANASNEKYCSLKDSKLIWEIYKEKKNYVYLRSGNKKIITDVNNISIVDFSKFTETNNSRSSSISVETNGKDMCNEIMLRHKTKLEAMNELDKFIDNAVLFRLPYVKIIHGKNGGIIRKAVHEYLDASPYILSYHYGEYHQGGFGVTIANLHN